MVRARWTRRLWSVALAATVLSGGLAAQDLDSGGPAAAGPYEGFTRPSLEVTVGSRVDGLVDEVFVEEGQAVVKGQVLVRLDATLEKIDVELSRLQAESDKELEAMQLIEKQRAADLERARSLLKDGGITGVQVEQKELELKVATLNVEIARNKQQVARLQYQRNLARLAQRDIKSPVDGVVTRLLKDPGEAVERLEKVAEVVQLDPLEVVLNLPVATRGKYRAGQKATVLLADDATRHAAEVKSVDPVVDFASHTYRVKVRLPNPGGKLQAGLRATVDLAGSHE